MKTTHTPGPWEYLPGDVEIVTQESDFGARSIAWSDADYRLIAAAPDLLAALRNARNLLRNLLVDFADTDGDEDTWNAGGNGYETLQEINAAIAKAEGATVPK